MFTDNIFTDTGHMSQIETGQSSKYIYEMEH